MTQIWKHTAIVAAMIVGVAAAINVGVATAKDSPSTLTLVADDWCPYTCDADGSDKGYAIDIATAIFTKHGITVKYLNVPWTRAIAGTESGAYGGAVGAAKAESKKLIYPQASVGISNTSFVASKQDGWQYTQIKDLNSRKIILMADYSYGDELDAYFKTKQANLHYVRGNDPLKKGFFLLLNRDPNVLADDTYVLQYNMKRLGMNESLRMAGEHKDKTPIYIGFQPTDQGKAWAKLFSEGIKELRQSGKLHDILDRYGLKDWATPQKQAN